MKKRFTFILTFILALTALFGTSASAATYPTLKNGSSGTQVKYLQMNLNGIGYSCGEADGAYGSKTKKAVTSFQKDYGLSADGIAGKNTLSKMESIIKSIQNNLNKLGYSCGTADGIMGSNTVKALKKFQKAYGLTADGVATASVQKKLTNAVKEAENIKLYTVTYDNNGGQGTSNISTFSSDSSHTIISNKPTKSGYVFKGWSTSKNGSVQYKAGDKYSTHQNITLYAVWHKYNAYRDAAETFVTQIINGKHPVAQLGDTHSEYTKWFYGSSKKVDWCAIWCSWALEQLDVEWTKASGCGTFRETMKKAGAFHKISDNNYTPKTGDLILFSNNNGDTHCHVGMVVMNGSTVQVLHGNYNTGGVEGGGKLTFTKDIMKSDYLKARMHAYCDMEAYINYTAG